MTNEEEAQRQAELESEAERKWENEDIGKQDQRFVLVFDKLQI